MRGFENAIEHLFGNGLVQVASGGVACIERLDDAHIGVYSAALLLRRIGAFVGFQKIQLVLGLVHLFPRS